MKRIRKRLEQSKKYLIAINTNFEDLRDFYNILQSVIVNRFNQLLISWI